ncbi:pseudouridine synthase [Acetivibrio cellulolyticus]|uniref:pseudouridine synthase n=1 Tax=Acetivibrio cellulolyticus TaxID=35830 RepID=UPI0001E2F13E|nr:pseudouridine synthase [Acetivibrio cellulolyticus]
MEMTRLQKYIADCGVASRRKAEELIQQGSVKVNGIVVSEMGIKVSSSDRVEVNGSVIKPESKKVYILLNKPSGYVTTVKDQFRRPTVIDLLKGVDERVFPVGRLDYETTGLLVLTNDGDFTHKMTHPRHEIEKTYQATIAGTPTKDEIHSFESGLEIEDYVTSPAKLKIISTKERTCVIEVTIHEGRNRQVRKMCEAIGHPVLALKRISLGKVTLGNLPEGSWRELTRDEVNSLRNS